MAINWSQHCLQFSVTRQLHKMRRSVDTWTLIYFTENYQLMKVVTYKLNDASSLDKFFSFNIGFVLNKILELVWNVKCETTFVTSIPHVNLLHQPPPGSNWLGFYYSFHFSISELLYFLQSSQSNLQILQEKKIVKTNRH